MDDPVAAQKLLGYKDMSMTEDYIKARQTEVVKPHTRRRNKMNLKAMKTTRDEYVSNFTAIKGEEYADFMQSAAEIITGGNAIRVNLDPSTKVMTEVILDRIMAIALAGLAKKAGIPDERLSAAMDDCIAMVKAVENARGIPESVH